MKLSLALSLALALGWARENASFTLPFAIPKARRHSAPLTSNEVSFFTSSSSSLSPSSLSFSSSSSSSPHPPEEPPSNDLLNLYYASTLNPMSPDQPPTPTQPEQQQQPSQEVSSSSTTTSATTTIESMSIPAKPWMTEEQKEEMNTAVNRFVQDVWKPLFESSVQPGVPADTIKGAALVGATLAFLASKGLVVTSAAGLSAAYVAISQGVAGDVLRTMGGIAWDVTETATKLMQMATTTDPMTGLSKELVDTMAAAAARSESSTTTTMTQNNNNNDTTTSSSTNVQEATEAFLESQDELARVLREAETAIGAADAAIAQAEQTLWQDQLGQTSSTTLAPPFDQSVPYNAAAKLAYEASDQSMPFEDFEIQYIAESIALVKSKYQASSQALLEQAKQKMDQQKREQEEAAAKRKAAEDEKARLAAAEQEAKRKAAEEEKARLAAAEQEAKRKTAEEEKARLVAEQEAKRKAAEAEQARLAAAEQEAKRKAAEEEKAKLDAEQEAKRKAAEAEQARLAAAEQEAKRKAAEEEKARLAAAEQEARRKVAEEEAKRKAPIDVEEDDDDDWLAAVEMSQQGLEGKIVGLEDAIRDESGKASWDAAGALAEELGAFVDDDDDDYDVYDDDDDDDDVDDDDEYELEDLFDAETLEKLGLAARKAVEAFEEGDDMEELEGDDDLDVVDGAKGMDGMYVASSLGRTSSSSSRQTFQRDWNALTVAKLKDELRFRGLKAYGKKAELVAMLEAYDRDEMADGNNEDDNEEEGGDFLADDSDSEDELLDLGDLDLEELGRQARAAVELGTLGGFDAEEPSDEVLMQLENEESLLLSDFLGDGKKEKISKQKQTEKDYSRMTVLELKEELRERGLPLSGKKSELIERLLQATDLS